MCVGWRSHSGRSSAVQAEEDNLPAKKTKQLIKLHKILASRAPRPSGNLCIEVRSFFQVEGLYLFQS